jgi:4,4'-diaponeurosporenoate glycosyltransferase
MNEFPPWVIFCFWLFGFWLLWRIPVPGDRRALRRHRASLSVIIPARNEERNIGQLLASLKSGAGRPAEVIVVDDQSDDRTSEIAESFDVRTVRSVGPPPGWAGKPWACMQGAREARGDLFLFLDADTVMAPGGLEKLLSSFPASGGLISVQPYHHMKRAYERLSAVFNVIVLAGSNAFTPLGSRLKPMGAFGPCLLCSRQDYFSVGGHERVKGEILENVALGKVFLNAGIGVRCYGGKGVLSFRMYGEGFRSMVEGFTKSFGIGAGSIARINLLMIVCWVFGSVSLTRHLIHSALLGDWGGAVVWTVLYALYGVQFFWMLYRIGNFSVWPAALFPVPVLFFVLVFFISLFKVIFPKKTRWKGRIVNTGGGGMPGP